MDDRRYIQFVSAIFSIISALFIISKSRQAAKFRAIMIAPLVLFLHILIFYLSIFLFIVKDYDERLGFQFVANTWSAGINLHAVLTVGFLSYAILKCIPSHE